MYRGTENKKKGASFASAAQNLSERGREERRETKNTFLGSHISSPFFLLTGSPAPTTSLSRAIKLVEDNSSRRRLALKQQHYTNWRRKRTGKRDGRESVVLGARTAPKKNGGWGQAQRN